MDKGGSLQSCFIVGSNPTRRSMGTMTLDELRKNLYDSDRDMKRKQHGEKDYVLKQDRDDSRNLNRTVKQMVRQGDI